jgi:hypothetical protein
MKLMMISHLEYAMNYTDPKYWYPYPWAPHHLGYWPIADIMPNQQENMCVYRREAW